MENVVPEELQPEPLVVITPIQPEQPSKSPEAVVESVDAEVEVPAPVVENVVHEEIQPEPLLSSCPHNLNYNLGGAEDPGEENEVEPGPINIEIPLEPKLTLSLWLQPEAESADEVITTVLLSMNQEGPSSQDGKQIQQPEDEDQYKTPGAAPISLEDRCFIWATIANDNKYETIF
ncbi:hypothetical protein PIB30_075422 [Stylosanthes scabra]|uniref:Uncharacterized protein n=1 Tax=Stylosanthes scabra TaxID=79078 RepID=A0ABU6YPC8_9FABA|nr:hypothetical protein [Stylosanthes scabra]